MRLPAILPLVLLGGCVAYVHSPPGRSFPLESPKALYQRETGVQLEGGGGTEFDVGLPGFTARVRHGIVDKLDGSFEFGYQRIRTKELTLASSDRNVFTSRIGIKYAIIDHIALTAGLAGGGWAGGGFLSPDVSMILGYENPYCVPFFEGGGYTSHPVHANDVVITDTNPDSILGDRSLTAAPVLTYGWTVGFGLRIPLLHHESERETPPSILLGTRLRGAYYDPTYSNSRNDKNIYWYGSVGFEYVIKPRRSR